MFGAFEKAIKKSPLFRVFEGISHFFVLIYIIMPDFSQLFCNFGANSVHDAQKTSLELLVSD